jgi:hypothetical protein
MAGLTTTSLNSTTRVKPLSLAWTCSSMRDGIQTPETRFQSRHTTIRYFFPAGEVSSNRSILPVVRSSHISRFAFPWDEERTKAVPSSLTASGFSGMNLSGLQNQKGEGALAESTSSGGMGSTITVLVVWTDSSAACPSATVARISPLPCFRFSFFPFLSQRLCSATWEATAETVTAFPLPSSFVTVTRQEREREVIPSRFLIFAVLRRTASSESETVKPREGTRRRPAIAVASAAVRARRSLSPTTLPARSLMMKARGRPGSARISGLHGQTVEGSLARGPRRPSRVLEHPILLKASLADYADVVPILRKGPPFHAPPDAIRMIGRDLPPMVKVVTSQTGRYRGQASA